MRNKQKNRVRNEVLLGSDKLALAKRVLIWVATQAQEIQRLEVDRDTSLVATPSARGGHPQIFSQILELQSLQKSDLGRIMLGINGYPESLSTIILATPLDPTVVDPKVDRFWEFYSNSSIGNEKFLRVSLGTSTNSAREKVFIRHFGIANNGKTTMQDTVRSAVGDANVKQLSSADIHCSSSRAKASTGHQDSLMRGMGGTITFIPESESGVGQVLDVQTLKEITGEKGVRGSAKYQGTMNKKINGIQIMHSNQKEIFIDPVKNTIRFLA